MKQVKIIEVPVNEEKLDELENLVYGTEEEIFWTFETNDDCVVMINFVKAKN